MINDLDPCPWPKLWPGCRSCAQLPGDVTDPTFPQILVDRTIATLGGLDIIVNNAGYTWDSVIQKTTDEQFQAMLDIHAIAPSGSCARHPASFAKRQNGRPPRAGASPARWSISLRWRPPMAGRGRPATLGQSGRYRTHPHHGEGMGPLQRQCECGGIRLDRDAADAGMDGRFENRSERAGNQQACARKCWTRWSPPARSAGWERWKRPPERCSSCARRSATS